MAQARPKFSDMQSHYPTGTADEVKALIGGRVNAGWITNTCVIRLSRALNYSGDTHKVPRGGTMNTVSGDDGLWYGFRVREFIPFFKDRYGPPDVELNSGDEEHDIATGRIYGPPRLMRGVLALETDAWSDATGHVDLWDGTQCSSMQCIPAEYLTKATKVYCWSLPA